MTLIRLEPFREIESLQRQMNRLFEELHSSTHSLDSRPFVPAAELYETADALHLKIEVPGLSPEDIDIQVTPEAVAITGERHAETETEEKGMMRSEFRYGKFQRVIPLPVRIQNHHVEGEYKNGILNMNLPKAEEEKHRVVKVNVAG